MENPMNKWMIWVPTPIFGLTPPCGQEAKECILQDMNRVYAFCAFAFSCFIAQLSFVLKKRLGIRSMNTGMKQYTKDCKWRVFW